MIDKTYEPKSVEGRIYAAWQQANAFAAGAGAKPGAEPFSIVIPPPNVTGNLHVGHALNNTIQDILTRFNRMLSPRRLRPCPRRRRIPQRPRPTNRGLPSRWS